MLLGASRVGMMSAAPWYDDPSVIAHWQVDNENNVVISFSQTFAPSGVDTNNNTIAYSAATYNFNNTARSYTWTPVKFSSTGTLPAPLAADTWYYVWDKNSDGKLTVYPFASSANYSGLPGWYSMEDVPPAQYVYDDLGAIDITDQGTGTHTIYTNDLLRNMYDRVNDVDLENTSVNLNGLLEIEGTGTEKQVFSRGGLARRWEGSGGQYYGKHIKENVSAATFGALYEDKRYIAAVISCVPYSSPGVQVARGVTDPTFVDATTDRITFDVYHRLSTGDAFVSGVYPGGVLPAGVPASGWIRRIDANVIELYDTYAHAIDTDNTTGIYDITDTGTGKFYFVCPDNIYNIENSQFILDWTHPGNNNHYLTPTTTTPSINGLGTFVLGNANGNFVIEPDGEFVFNFDNNFPDLIDRTKAYKIDMVFSPNATGPTATDTGLPLVNGSFWFNLDSSSTSKIRIYRTEAAAVAGIGVATATCGCLLFSDYGSGKVIIKYSNDKPLFRTYSQPAGNFRQVTAGDMNILIAMIDRNPDDGTKMNISLGINEIWSIENFPHSTNKGITASTDPQCFFFNTNETHVPSATKVREVVLFASDNDLHAVLTSAVADLKTKYGIT